MSEPKELSLTPKPEEPNRSQLRFLDKESRDQVTESIGKLEEIAGKIKELEREREDYIGNIKLYGGLSVYREYLASKGKTPEEIEAEVGPWERGEKR